jgi:hypothetical protein
MISKGIYHNIFVENLKMTNGILIIYFDDILKLIFLEINMVILDY